MNSASKTQLRARQANPATKLNRLTSLTSWTRRFRFATGFALLASTVVLGIEKVSQFKNFWNSLQDQQTSIGWLFHGFTSYAPWIALVLLLFTVYLATHYIDLRLNIERRNVEIEAQQQRSVLFIAPKLDGFYAEYLTSLVHAARKSADGGMEFVVTPYVPTADANDNFQPEAELARIVKRMPQRPAGVFLIPSAPQSNQPKIIEFCQRFPDLHLVTLDVYPSVEKIDGYPHFVGGDERRGGKLAAQRAVGEIRKLAQSNRFASGEIRVLILVGAKTPWELLRPQGFEEELKRAEDAGELGASVLKLQIRWSRPLGYSFEEASNYILGGTESIDQSDHSIGDPLEFHVIFACNDEMALGAAQAMRALQKARGTDTKAPMPKVIGYDGTSRMKTVLALGHDFIAHTVCVDLESQACRAVATMTKLLSNTSSGSGMYLVEPRGWPRQS